MNLRHIDEMFERHSAGWKPFSGDFKIGRNPIKRVGGAFTGVLRQGYEFVKDASDTGYNLIGTKSPDEKARDANAENAAIAAARKAAHDTEVAQLSQASLGSVAMRRRKGLYASMFTGTPALSAPSTGKTLLSQ